MAGWRFCSLLMIAVSCAATAPANADRVSPRLLAFLRHQIRSDAEPLPRHARIASVSAGRAGFVHFVHWRDPDGCGSGGGCSLEICRERNGKVEFVGNIPIVDSKVTVFPARAGWLPEFMVDRWGAQQVFSRIAFNGWRYHPVWDKPPGAFPGKKLPGRIVISPRTPITTID